MPTILSGEFKVDVSFKNIKNMNMRILPPDGRIRISAPLHYNIKLVDQFIIDKQDWIRKTQSLILSRNNDTPILFEDGEIHYYLGNPYHLKIEKSKLYNWVEIKDDKLVVSTLKDLNPTQIEKLINAWYRKQMETLIQGFINKWEAPMEVKVNEFGIKRMKTRWGTCNPRAQRIWLSLELAKKPIECLEYVVVHEMVHLLEASHNHVFKTYMDQFLPSWRILKQKLRS